MHCTCKSCTEQTTLQKSLVYMKLHRNRNLSNIMVFFALANSAILFSGLLVIQYMCYDHLVSVPSDFVIRFLMTTISLDGHLELSMAAVKICCRTCGRCLVSMQTNALPEGSFFTNLSAWLPSEPMKMAKAFTRASDVSAFPKASAGMPYRSRFASLSTTTK